MLLLEVGTGWSDYMLGAAVLPGARRVYKCRSSGSGSGSGQRLLRECAYACGRRGGDWGEDGKRRRNVHSFDKICRCVSEKVPKRKRMKLNVKNKSLSQTTKIERERKRGADE